MSNYETVKFVLENIEVNINISINDKTVWLNLDDMAKLFNRDRSVIGKHIKNIISENYEKDSVWAKFARTGLDGKTYFVDYYNLDIVISLGYRLKSKNGILLKEFTDRYFEENKENIDSIIIYNDGDINLAVNVSPNEDTVWLNRNQIAELYDTTRPNVAMHIKNIIGEGELDGTCCKNFLHDVDGRSFEVTYYNLDIILAVGYRIKSKRAIAFRKWASSKLKEYLLKGYSIDERRITVTYDNYLNLVNKVEDIDIKLSDHEEMIKKVNTKIKAITKDIKDDLNIKHFVTYENKRVEASIAYKTIFALAKKTIHLVDDYISLKTLQLLKCCDKKIKVIIYSDNIAEDKVTSEQLEDFKKDTGIDIQILPSKGLFHDRYIFLDYKTKRMRVFNSGPSIKDAGRKRATIQEIGDTRIYVNFLDI